MDQYEIKNGYALVQPVVEHSTAEFQVQGLLSGHITRHKLVIGDKTNGFDYPTGTELVLVPGRSFDRIELDNGEYVVITIEDVLLVAGGKE